MGLTQIILGLQVRISLPDGNPLLQYNVEAAGCLPEALLKQRRDICTWGRYLFMWRLLSNHQKREYGVIVILLEERTHFGE